MSSPNDYRKFAVLYVDDEEQALKYFRKMLDKEFQILTAISVAAAGDEADAPADGGGGPGAVPGGAGRGHLPSPAQLDDRDDLLPRRGGGQGRRAQPVRSRRLRQRAVGTGAERAGSTADDRAEGGADGRRADRAIQ